MTKTESCLSTTDQVNGRGTVATICQALTHTKSNERIVDGSYGFVVPDSYAGVSFTVAMALSCQIAVGACRLR